MQLQPPEPVTEDVTQWIQLDDNQRQRLIAGSVQELKQAAVQTCSKAKAEKHLVQLHGSCPVLISQVKDWIYSGMLIAHSALNYDTVCWSVGAGLV